MDFSILWGAAATAAVISGLVSFLISRKERSLQYITAERKEWREKMREIASAIDGASYKETLKILTELKVRINSFGNYKKERKFSEDSHIWDLINEIEAGKLPKEILALKQKQMIEYIGLLLKSDWERSKVEVRGNIVSAFSFLFLGVTAICFSVFVILCNKNESIGTLDLILMIVIYIFLVSVCILVYDIVLKGACKSVIDVKDGGDGAVKLGFCYIFCGGTVLIQVGIYYKAVTQCFSFIGYDPESGLVFVALSVIYMTAVVFRCVYQLLNVDKEYYYVNAINKIRSSNSPKKSPCQER